MDITSIQSYLSPKEFQLIINGILQVVKSQIQENTFHVTNNLNDYELLFEKLKTLNAELEINDLQSIVQVFELIVKKGAVENWSSEAFTDFLNSRNVPEDYSNIFVALWTKESQKIHQKLVDLSTFNNTLSKNIQWRVDMNAMSKQSADINEVIAHFELNLKPFPRDESNEKKDIIAKFEMNRDEIHQMLQQFTQIQNVYQQLMTQTSATN